MRIALLSNVTVDFLAGLLKKKEHYLYLSSGFDTWQQDALFTSSPLYESNPEAVVVLLHAGAYDEAWTSKEKGIQTIDEWCNALASVVTNLPNIPVFVSSIDITNTRCRFASKPCLEAFFENYLIERIQELHSSGKSIYILPVKELICDLGRSSFYSAKMWYMGSMPYSMKGLSALSALIDRYTSRVKTARKKCLAVDLDNTLWGGVIGEDGVNGIVLSGHKEGARYKDTQRLLLEMKNQGIMLAILSKNNKEDVEPVFNHPDMLLHHSDFVAEVINWEPKSQNIRQLAKDLNIGLDSFVFLDDNPAEREIMKAECPEVTVIAFPADSSQLPDVVAKAYDDHFFSLDVTKEDLKKTAMYQSEVKRKEVLKTATSFDDFLKKLEMAMDIHLMTVDETARVTQLTNKTNQFNLTTRRYSAEEIHTLAHSKDSDIITVHMSDKYGDQGLVSVVILKYTQSVAEIDTFLMSCRVMGRNAEKQILAEIKKLLVTKGIQSIKASFIKTAKNTPVQDLYEKLGFSRISRDECVTVGDRKDYIASVASLPSTTSVFNVSSALG